MIVLAWFTIMGFVILTGFGLLVLTFVHWYKEGRRQRRAEAEKLAHLKASSSQPT